jgi:hypothetical protein
VDRIELNGESGISDIPTGILSQLNLVADAWSKTAARLSRSLTEACLDNKIR